MPAPISIEWEERDAHLAFIAPKIVLAAPQLTDGVYTDARLASIAWLPTRSFDLYGPMPPAGSGLAAAAPRVATTSTSEGHAEWRHFALEHGCTYQLRLTEQGRDTLQRRGEIRYAELFQRLGGGPGLSPAAPGNQQIMRLSTAFYTRVFERGGPSFRSAFAQHVSGVEEAATNQAKW